MAQNPTTGEIEKQSLWSTWKEKKESFAVVLLVLCLLWLFVCWPVMQEIKCENINGVMVSGQCIFPPK